MNKNYKENIKNRNEGKSDFQKTKKLDIKEFAVKKESELLSYLIDELHYSRNNAKNLLSHHLIAIDGAPISQFNFMIYPGDTLIIAKSPIRKKERSKLPIIFAGTPPTTLPAGISFVTTAPGAIITFGPIVTLYIIVAPAPTKTFEWISILPN